MNATYHFGLLLLIFGGFLTLSSTEFGTVVGLWSLVIGLLVGVLGVIRSGLPS